MATNLKNRLAKVEQKLAKIKERETLANCNCNVLVLIGRGLEEQFRAEMNRTCPAHGFRQLTVVHLIEVEPCPRGEFATARTIENPEGDALLKEYHRRRAESKRAA